MRKIVGKILACFMALSCMFVAFSGCGEKKSKFSTPHYEVNALQFEDMNEYEGEVWDGAESHNGPLENGMIISPYLTCKINGQPVDVYASRATNGAHSFGYVDVAGEDVHLEVELTLAKSRKSVVVLPLSKGVKATLKTREVKATIKDTGSFTFAFDDKEDRGFTLIVKKQTKLEIPEGYTKKEFEPGTYTAAETNFTEGNTVYYFKPGKYRIGSINVPSNSIVYFDYAFFTVTAQETTAGAIVCANTENTQVLGRSVFDFSEETAKEPFRYVNAKNFKLEGVTSINSSTWTFCFTGCEGGRISNILGIAYRTTSDGIMIASSNDMEVTDSFMRTGDDAFEVKCTGARPSHDITYSDCHAWNDKGCAFGVVYEMNYEVYNVNFLNCSVGFNMPTWNITRAAATICMDDYERGRTNHDITFDGFEVYYTKCPTISICLHSGSVKDVHFKNFKVEKNYAAYPVYFAFNQPYLGTTIPTNKRVCSIENAYFENISVEGKEITKEQIMDVDEARQVYLNGKKVSAS